MKRPELLPLRVIWVSVPRKRILSCLKKGIISRRETSFFVNKIEHVDAAIDELRHVRSVVEKVLYRSDKAGDEVRKRRSDT